MIFTFTVAPEVGICLGAGGGVEALGADGVGGGVFGAAGLTSAFGAAGGGAAAGGASAFGGGGGGAALGAAFGAPPAKVYKKFK